MGTGSGGEQGRRNEGHGNVMLKGKGTRGGIVGRHVKGRCKEWQVCRTRPKDARNKVCDSAQEDMRVRARDLYNGQKSRKEDHTDGWYHTEKRCGGDTIRRSDAAATPHEEARSRDSRSHIPLRPSNTVSSRKDGKVSVTILTRSRAVPCLENRAWNASIKPAKLPPKF